jgi:hypothetical protein
VFLHPISEDGPKTVHGQVSSTCSLQHLEHRHVGSSKSGAGLRLVIQAYLDVKGYAFNCVLCGKQDCRGRCEEDKATEKHSAEQSAGLEPQSKDRRRIRASEQGVTSDLQEMNRIGGAHPVNRPK